MRMWVAVMEEEQDKAKQEALGVAGDTSNTDGCCCAPRPSVLLLLAIMVVSES
jgi:hypothetical protein